MNIVRALVIAVLAGVSSTTIGETSGQTPAVPYTPRPSDRPAALEGDEPGFQAIVDGRTLDGWDGDATFWRVEDGALVGEITHDTVNNYEEKGRLFLALRGQRTRPHADARAQRSAHECRDRRRPSEQVD